MTRLTFCIACKNRFWQISKTLPLNLHHNYDDRNFVKFVLVDFGSSDGLKDWVLADFKKEIDCGYLKYYFTEALPNWHASIAKNTAHYHSNGDILVNLDCDNFTGKRGGKFIIEQFDELGDKVILHQFSGDYNDGSFGRIGVKKKYFSFIGGYDESLLPMSFQDIDLIERLTLLGLKYKLVTNLAYNAAIKNTKEESVINTGSKLKYIDMNCLNYLLSSGKLRHGEVIANNGKFGIRENVLSVEASSRYD